MKYFTILSFAFLMLIGCSDPVRVDLKGYSQQIKFLAQDEEKVLDKWNSVSGIHFVNDGFMYQALDTYIVDNYDEFDSKLKEVKPQTKEIQDLHAGV